VIIAAVSLAVAQFLTLLVQPEMWQRVAAAKSRKHLKKALTAAWGYLMVVVVPLIVIGLSVQATGSVDDPGNILLGTLQNTAPEWYLPILITTLFAALMSTIDSSLFAVSSQLGKHGLIAKQQDLSLDQEDGQDKQTWRTRVAVAFVAAATLIGSLFFGGFLSGVFNLISLLTVLSTAVLLSFGFGMSSGETFVTLLVGISLFVGAFSAGFITEQAVTTLYPSLALAGYVLAQTLTIRGYTFLSSNHN